MSWTRTLKAAILHKRLFCTERYNSNIFKEHLSLNAIYIILTFQKKTNENQLKICLLMLSPSQRKGEPNFLHSKIIIQMAKTTHPENSKC